MAKINGTDLLVSTESGVIGGATSHTLTLDVDLPEATTKDSEGWGDDIHGLRTFSCDVDALSDPENPVDSIDIVGLILNRTEVTLTGTAAGYTWTGKAKVQNYSENADMENPVSFSVSFKGNKKFTTTPT